MENRPVKDQILDLHLRMRDIVLAAGVPPLHYAKPLKDLDSMDLEAFLRWLQEFESGPYTDVINIWGLKPPEWWANMESLFGQRETREHKILYKERKKLRRAWYKRYGRPGDEQKGEESVED